MNRRAFLGVVGGTVAAVVAVGASAPRVSDDFAYRGWRVRWRGWKSPVNQEIVIGYWTATQPPPNPRFLYSTTMGVVRGAGELDVLDLTWMRGEWPSPHALAAASESEREAVKAAAWRALKSEIDGA
jgi:hypothetical protein